ncbi:hypothetical protein [Verrucomicrobium spinosum]|uniref:hypothetical protein n=1 Tax=Verrucomicrobium spinosum TaxID=2736 RepID=UPI00017446EF|nr:hypothetical protein [Verrucomicrobium spinosum]
MLRYFSRLNRARKVLWSYLLWWIHTIAHHFEPRPRLWLTSLGLSGIIGLALLLSTRTSTAGTTRLDRWQIFRLFLMPFCVSSFAALVKDQGFLLIFPPTWQENFSALTLIAAFWGMTALLERVYALKMPSPQLERQS